MKVSLTLAYDHCREAAVSLWNVAMNVSSYALIRRPAAKVSDNVLEISCTVVCTVAIVWRSGSGEDARVEASARVIDLLV